MSWDPRLPRLSTLSNRTTTRLVRRAAVLLAGTATLAVPAPALADGGVIVTINDDPGRGKLLTFARVAGGVDQNQVATTRRVNKQDNTEFISGTRAKRLVELAGVAPSALDGDSAMSVSSSDGGTPVTVTAAEVNGGLFGDPIGLPDPHYATFSTDFGREVNFFRPLRASTDTNTANVDPPTTSDLRVHLQTTGQLLTVHITPSSTQIDAKQNVAFDVTVTPQPDDSDATYTWDYEGNGEPVTTSAADSSHIYETNGLFAATLNVTTLDGDSGSASVDIQVGPKGGGGNTPPPPPPPGAAGGGGTGGGGGGTQGGGAGTGGPKAPSRGPSKGPKTQSSTGSKKPSSSTKEGTSKTPSKSKKPKTNAPPDTKHATPDAAEPPGTAATATSRRPGQARPAADRKRKAKPEPAPAPRGPGVRVRGILLAGTSAFTSALPAALTPAARDALARSAARAGASSPGGVLGLLSGLSLAAAVLLSGVLTERRAIVRGTARAA